MLKKCSNNLSVGLIKGNADIMIGWPKVQTKVLSTLDFTIMRHIGFM